MVNTHDKVVSGGSVVTRATSACDVDGKFGLTGIEIVWMQNDQASNANGVRLYARDNTGTWREVDCKDDNGAATIGSASPQAVAALSAGQERRLFIDVSRYVNGVAVEYTAGGTGPTNWSGVIALHYGAVAVLK